jgi:exopolyphosphatase
LLLTQSSFNSGERSAFIETAVKAGGQVAAEAVGQSPEEEDEVSIESSSVKSPKVLEAASAYYRILSAKKLDVSRLNTIDLLRRDYKENAIKLGKGGGGTSNLTAGFSSVPVGLSDWVHERHGNGKDRWDGYWGALRDWMKQKGLDVAVIGTSFREQVEEEGEKGKHKREL